MPAVRAIKVDVTRVQQRARAAAHEHLALAPADSLFVGSALVDALYTADIRGRRHDRLDWHSVALRRALSGKPKRILNFQLEQGLSE